MYLELLSEGSISNDYVNEKSPSPATDVTGDVKFPLCLHLVYVLYIHLTSILSFSTKPARF